MVRLRERPFRRPGPLSCLRSWYHFGDTLTTVNRNDRDAVVGLLGITLSY
jgi:hypothetical protein